MFSFLQRLFGKQSSVESTSVPSRIRSVDLQTGPHERRATAIYYDAMSKLQRAISQRDFQEAAKWVRLSLTQMSDWVAESKEAYGSFDIGSIPAIEDGGRVLALLGDDEGLAEMRRVVGSIPDLARWLETMDQRQRDKDLFDAILAAVGENPGCLQTDVKSLVGEPDGQRIATLISYLERAGKLGRIRAGRTYQLVLPGSAEFPEPPPQREIASHRVDRAPPPMREIDVSKLSYVPLPRSPLRWEEVQTGRERANTPEPDAAFEVRHADWQITSIEKIPPADRPDPAFGQTNTHKAGLMLIDATGKAGGLGRIEAAAICYNHQGEVTAKAALGHGVYRIGVHPLGEGMIALSRGCVLHAYDDQLKPIFETPLAAAPEIQAIRTRFEIGDDELKNHIRCVALSRDAKRYLFTAVDEAWCIGADGRGLWGAKLPIKDGWQRVGTRSEGAGTSEEVDHALALMDLSLPITPDDVKSRYRVLAKRWHPDLNPGDVSASDRMKALNGAVELLTGIESSSVSKYAGVAFFKELDRREIDAGGFKITMTMGIQVGERYASDWIYAASFAGRSDSVYLAGYSGRVVLVDENGVGLRVYDIGAVPRRIVDTGDYLYLLTDTRLYVLRGDALHALIDTFDGGDLIVADNGFGLLEKKRFRWHKADGTLLGSVVTRDPIRRVYRADGDMVVESRQQRARVSGVAGWWREDS